MGRKKKHTVPTEEQQKALKELVLSMPVEDILPDKNAKAVQNLKRAGLTKNDS